MCGIICLYALPIPRFSIKITREIKKKKNNQKHQRKHTISTVKPVNTFLRREFFFFHHFGSNFWIYLSFALFDVHTRRVEKRIFRKLMPFFFWTNNYYNLELCRSKQFDKVELFRTLLNVCSALICNFSEQKKNFLNIYVEVEKSKTFLYSTTPNRAPSWWFNLKIVSFFTENIMTGDKKRTN